MHGLSRPKNQAAFTTNKVVNCYQPLVLEDALFVRMGWTTKHHDETTSVLTDRVLKLFVPAFQETWRRIPKADRRKLLFHWRSHPGVAVNDSGSVSIHRPLIQIVENVPRVGHETGCRLDFPMAWVELNPSDLRRRIAGELLVVYRHACPRYHHAWKDLMEHPLNQWKRQRKGSHSEQEEWREEERLEKAYCVRRKALDREILQRWSSSSVSTKSSTFKDASFRN
jgi:hypothetical protein